MPPRPRSFATSRRIERSARRLIVFTNTSTASLMKSNGRCREHPGIMAEVFLIRVTTDTGEHQVWAAAMPSEQGLQTVLDAIPEGWTVSLLMRATADEIAALALKPGEVRELPNA